jgi:hypothetical protein
MSAPSYKLSKRGLKWIASGILPSGRKYEIDCGQGTRDRATGIADQKLNVKLAASTASRARWAKFFEQRHAAPTSREASPSAPPSASPLPSASPSTAPAPEPSAVANEPKPDRNREIWSKLKSLGDNTSSERESVEPDEVIPPGARASSKDKDDDDDDEENDDEDVTEFGGDLFATMIVSGTIKAANAPLAKRNPPERGMPDERASGMYHKGMTKVGEKLIGKGVKLSTGAQVFWGCLLTCGTIWINSEIIPEDERTPEQRARAGAAPAAAAAPSSPAAPRAAAPAPAAAPSSPAAPPAEERPAETSLALAMGTFGVPRRTN